jgi:hypothetical protein
MKFAKLTAHCTTKKKEPPETLKIVVLLMLLSYFNIRTFFNWLFLFYADI